MNGPALVLSTLLVFLGGQLAGGQSPPLGQMTVTLLGTGTPLPRVEHMGPSTLIEAGGQALLFDVGRGTVIRLVQARVPAENIRAIFLTHLHSDHISGLPDFWLTSWLPSLGGRRTPLRVFGPKGTRAMTDGFKAAFAEDIRMRTLEERLPASGADFAPSEFDADATVFEEGGVRVESFAVDHGGELRPAHGFRVTYGGRSVVISGDTRYSENLILRAAGADVIVHEVIAAGAEAMALPGAQFRLSHHTSPADAARVFQRVKPRLAVFTHLALIPDRQGRVPTAEEIVTEASREYKGRIEVGEDLMRIVVSDSIEVQRPRSQ